MIAERVLFRYTMTCAVSHTDLRGPLLHARAVGNERISQRKRECHVLDSAVLYGCEDGRL